MTGIELRRIRLRLGLTQREFAAVLGYSRSRTISEMERGVVPIPEWTAISATQQNHASKGLRNEI